MRCVGTDRPDLVRGSDALDAIYGRDGDDILKGREETNPVPNFAEGERLGATFGVGSPEKVQAGVLGGE